MYEPRKLPPALGGVVPALRRPSACAQIERHINNAGFHLDEKQRRNTTIVLISGDRDLHHAIHVVQNKWQGAGAHGAKGAGPLRLLRAEHCSPAPLPPPARP